MNMVLVYMLFISGLASFAATLAGQENAYLRYGHYVLLVISAGYCIHLLLQRKLVLTGAALFIAGYILVRIVAVSSFALSHDYTLPGYVYPLKNWLLLFVSFVIGQSIVVSFESVNRMIVKVLYLTILVLLVFEITGSLYSSHFSQLFPLPSRISFIPYRIGIDEFAVVYAYLLLSLAMIRKEVTLRSYFIGTIVTLVAILISQTKQTLVAIILVSLFLTIRRQTDYLTKRKCIFAVSSILAAVAIGAGMYLLMTTVPSDTYLSLWRRGLALHFAWDKISSYPFFGYPIPSNAFGGVIPKDIIQNFYGFNFETTIFPSDIPLLFVLAEEGIVGLLFVALFLYFCYRKAPERAPYVIVVLLSLIGTYRMYYLIPVDSSFTYFLLGLATRNNSEG